MKPYRIALFVLVLVCLPLGLRAYDWESRGIKVQNTEQNGEEIYLSLVDGSGRQFGIKYFNELAPADVEQILNLRNSFYGWKNMKPARMDFFVTGQVIEIAVFPQKFTYKNTDLLPFVPGGMLFTQAGDLSYNFRITRNNIFIRIAGQYRDEDELGAKMLEAINDPQGFLKKRDPEFFLVKLTALEERDRAMQQQYESLLKEHQALLESHRRLVNAVMTFHNTGFLGFGEYAIDPKVVSRIVELKTADPSMKLDAIRARLEQEGLKASKDEVHLVLGVYFNDFED